MLARSFLLAFFILFSLSILAAGFPGTPHQFYGIVSIDGVTATGGTITVERMGEVIATTVIQSDGTYGYNPHAFFVEDIGYNLHGKEIIFYVQGIEATPFIFENGLLTRLDLGVLGYSGFCGDSIIQSGEQCDDGNTLKGDGCSSECQNEIIVEPNLCGNDVIDYGEECDDGADNVERCDNDRHDCEYCSNSCEIKERKEKDDDNNDNRKKQFSTSCTPLWECTSWSICEDSQRMRSCYDVNGCGLDVNMPLESQFCGSIQEQILLGEPEHTPLPFGLWILLGLILISGVVIAIWQIKK